VFTGRTAMETILQHVQTTPVPASHRTELQIPAALDRLILDCLEKNPDNRPATADAVTARLTAVELAVPWTSEQAGQWWEGHHPEGSRVLRF
jgi:hypothetical protein